jgi:hypothetical protein
VPTSPHGVIISIAKVDTIKENTFKCENTRKSPLDKTDFPAFSKVEIVELEEKVMFTLLSVALA